MKEDPVVALLDRAGSILRLLAEPGWERIAEAVIAAIRAAPRGGSPLAAEDPGDTGREGSISVSDLVVRLVLARALRLEHLGQLNSIDVAADGTELRSIHIELTARYGAELNDLVDRVRRVATTVVHDLLGDVGTIPRVVDVVITDVVEASASQSEEVLGLTQRH